VIPIITGTYIFLTNGIHSSDILKKKGIRNTRRVLYGEEEKKKKKCVSNSMTSSHNDSFGLLFMCMFIAFIQLISDKHLACLNGIQAYLYREYMSASMFKLFLMFSFSFYISV
jgi:hypothetical protein